MVDAATETALRRMSSPRAMALAGVVFALLFATSLVLTRSALPESLLSEVDLQGSGAARLAIAMTIMPFAGIAFLYLLGVLRDTFGDAEDKVFSTVFLGSGILFLAMAFVAAAIAGAVLAMIEVDPGQDSAVLFGRAVMLQITNVFALRMAGVFMISLATMWLRHAALPKWISFVTYGTALVLLVVVSLSLWVTLIFPGWALAVSLYLLVRTYRLRPSAGRLPAEPLA
jgi:hypothetical protein